jgi:hypothetical protein
MAVPTIALPPPIVLPPQPQPLQSQQSIRDAYAAAMAPQINFMRSAGQPGGLAMGKPKRGNPLVGVNPWGAQAVSPMQNALNGMFTQV